MVPPVAVAVVPPVVPVPPSVVVLLLQALASRAPQRADPSQKSFEFMRSSMRFGWNTSKGRTLLPLGLTGNLLSIPRVSPLGGLAGPNWPEIGPNRRLHAMPLPLDYLQMPGSLQSQEDGFPLRSPLVILPFPLPQREAAWP